MRALQGMGHDVVHINLRFNFHLPLYKAPLVFLKRILINVLFRKNLRILQENFYQRVYEERCSITDPFYHKYIKHSDLVRELKQLKKYQDFDAYIVGSDQVWRKNIAGKYLYSMFLDFLSDTCTAKRYAYGVSLGTVECEYSDKDLALLKELYSRFDAVSVRESFALDMFKEYGWITPSACQVLDPTLLLNKEDYINLVRNGITVKSSGDMFCYILDMTEEKRSIIKEKEQELGLKSFIFGIGKEAPSIEQWLRSFMDAQYIITDSYHGLLFSIIFNKPFYLIMNKTRGAARFEAIKSMLGLTENVEFCDWEKVNNIIESEKKKSLAFLKGIA